MDFESERQSHLEKLTIQILNPIFKPVWGKVSHVANQHLAHEIAYNFPLALGKGMRCVHARAFEQNECLFYECSLSCVIVKCLNATRAKKPCVRSSRSQCW